MPTPPAGWRLRWFRQSGGSATSSRSRRSTTRSSRWRPPAAPPTLSCTCSRSPAGWGSSCGWRTSIGSAVPLLVNLQPAGTYLMDDMYRAGGLLAVLREVQDLLDPTAVTVTGRPLRDYLGDARIWDEDVIRPRKAPLMDNAGIAVLRGTLAPDGAVIKPAAASKELLVHRGRAVVFDSIEDFHARIDDPDLDIDETCVMVLRGCGPKGYPGMQI